MIIVSSQVVRTDASQIMSDFMGCACWFRRRPAAEPQRYEAQQKNPPALVFMTDLLLIGMQGMYSVQGILGLG